MRALGEISEAVLAAARDLRTVDQAPTLPELCARAKVSRAAATSTVKNLVRSGKLRIPRTRKVDYRNRPVAEYEPSEEVAGVSAGADELQRVMTFWVSR